MGKVAKKIIPSGTVVCRWSEFIPYPHPVTTWIIEEPTGPYVSSYWARGLGWGKTHGSVRVGADGLITLEEYERAYKDYQNEQLVKLLKR